ncbi:ATP-binding cassette domain-containing protein [Agromyces endophyticus]|uniref:ATP-binding cassette domain-containing protein n=1 Tax=Agromyces sp. H17E-10 TaxID=2932244 RepID=UPI001FD08969|nr:ATP-binding cassette domain-containing protein [Agromyces sp. H17E-10]UOQ87990.1 ATP-binding cassette domain-containing protein [Agromyces sp. H17E-10]
MFRFRPAPLRLAIVLAAVFVATRVVYRVLFAGAGGSGVVLVDLPVVRLPAPFEHVAMFGPITTGGLVAAVESALPIAIVILAFGVVNACIDVSRVFARAARGGPLAGSARALVIAWSTFPALADAVRRVRIARRLRGERGAGALVVPILEHTIERSIAIAAAMEVRGFAASHRVEGDCARPVEVRGAVLTHGADGGGRDAAAQGAQATDWSLSVPELRLEPGTLTVLAGPTGSGKSTLLDTLSGVHTHVDGGRASGSITVGGVDRLTVAARDTAGFVGVVAQDPRLGFTSETVDDEIGFALTVRGVAPVIVASRVAEVLARIGAEHLVGRDLRTLSAGEGALVAIGAAIVEQPVLLLVDEPLADLDPEARARITALLGRIAHEAGVCVLVAEHRADAFAAVADRWLEIADGVLVEGTAGSVGRVGAPAPYRDHTREGLDTVLRRSSTTGVDVRGSRYAPSSLLDHREGDSSLLDRQGGGLRVDGITVRHGDRVAVDDVSFSAAPGEIVAIGGPNGAGKSSLLTAIALGGDAGTVRTADEDAPGRRRDRSTPRSVALVPDRSDDLLFTDTVEAECRRADRTGRRPRGTTWALFTELLGATVGRGGASESTPHEHPRPTRGFETRPTSSGAPQPAIDQLAGRHPRDLSAGQRRLLVIAVQAAGEASVLLVDEPTRGLDPQAQAALARSLRLIADRGRTVVVATHDRGFAADVADRELTMVDGRLAESRVERTDAPTPAGGAA